MKTLIAVLAVAVLAACSTPTAQLSSPAAGGSGFPCPGGQGTCFNGGNYPASHLSEGGNPDKGGDK